MSGVERSRPRVWPPGSGAGALCAFVTRWELGILLVVAPALWFPTPGRALAMMVIPLLWLCAYVGTGRLLPASPLDAAVWVLCAMVLVSLTATHDLRLSLPKVTGVVLGIATFYGLVRQLRTRSALSVAVAVYALAGAGLAVVGLLGTQWLDKIAVLSWLVDRLPPVIRGLPGAEEGFHPNAVAGTLVLFIPVQVMMIAAPLAASSGFGDGSRLLGRLAARSTQIPLLLVTAGTLVLTQSRGGWLAVACGLALLLAAHGPRCRRALAVGVGLAAAGLWWVGPGAVTGRLFDQLGPSVAGRVSSRAELWTRALVAVEDFPITGTGMNAFREIQPVLYPMASIPDDFDVAHAHNHLLQAALDLGIAGLVAYLALWLVTGWLLVSVIRRPAADPARGVGLGLGGGLLAYFVFGVGDAIPLGAKVGVVFWIALALVVAVFALPGAAGGDGTPDGAGA